MELHERLRLARSRHFEKANQAADRLGVARSTYANHEAGSRTPPAEALERYAKVFRVPLAWLALGEGADTPGEVLPLMGRVGAGGSIATSTSQEEPGLDYEVRLEVQIPDATEVYEVVGESMLPVYEPGTILVIRGKTTDPRPLIGKRLAVETTEGDRFVKLLVDGTEPNRYNLESLNAGHAVIRNVEIAWVAQIAAIIPADQWYRIEKFSRIKPYHDPSIAKRVYKKRSSSHDKL